jgi:hypothetical protein
MTKREHFESHYREIAASVLGTLWVLRFSVEDMPPEMTREKMLELIDERIKAVGKEWEDVCTA